MSLEDTKSDANSSAYGGAWQKGEADHYAPNAVAGVGYKAGNFGFKVVGGYDSIVEEGAIKARLDADFGAFKAFVMGGWNTDGGKLNQYAGSNMVDDGLGLPEVHGADCGWGDWAVWGGIGYTFDPRSRRTPARLHRYEDLRRDRQRSLEPGQGSADPAGSLLHQLGCRRHGRVGRYPAFERKF